MNWLTGYMVIALVAAAVASVIADRFRTSAGGAAALLAGLIWPVVIVGSAQLAVWMAAVELSRKPLRPVPVSLH